MLQLPAIPIAFMIMNNIFNVAVLQYDMLKLLIQRAENSTGMQLAAVCNLCALINMKQVNFVDDHAGNNK